MKGRSIEDRLAIVNDGTEMGDGEVDMVVGQHAGSGVAIFTPVEKVMHNYIVIRI